MAMTSSSDRFDSGYDGVTIPGDDIYSDKDYQDDHVTNGTADNATFPPGKGGHYDDSFYAEYYSGDDAYSTFYHTVYPFEEYIYLYVWPLMVILTTLTNLLVILVLIRKNMRTSTNIILIAIAVSDTMTGLVTLPAYIHAYRQRDGANLELSRFWCEYFMITKLFLARAFHTMSVWLTLVLGFQRLISVSSPFKAHSMFSIQKTVVMIGLVFICSPVIHIYQLTEEKTDQDSCGWHLKDPCQGACIYIWVTFYLAHFIPCLLLVAFTVVMVIKLRKTTEKMIHANMISNAATIRRRSAENRRISMIVIVIVILFLVPEIPYSVYLVLNVSLTHAKKDLLHVKSNRAFVCTYEILMVASFHANFWVYLIMNRKFRHGLFSLFWNRFSDAISEHLDIKKQSSEKSSRRQSVNNGVGILSSDGPNNHHVGPTDDLSSKTLEMKTYTFNQNGGNVTVSD